MPGSSLGSAHASNHAWEDGPALPCRQIPDTLRLHDSSAMAILRESFDLVIDGSDFYRSIEYAPITKLRNGWCDFRALASQQSEGDHKPLCSGHYLVLRSTRKRPPRRVLRLEAEARAVVRQVETSQRVLNYESPTSSITKAGRAILTVFARPRRRLWRTLAPSRVFGECSRPFQQEVARCCPYLERSPGQPGVLERNASYRPASPNRED